MNHKVTAQEWIILKDGSQPAFVAMTQLKDGALYRCATPDEIRAAGAVPICEFCGKNEIEPGEVCVCRACGDELDRCNNQLDKRKT